MSSHFPLGRALLGRCPACGDGPLFDGYLTLAARCTVCGLKFDQFDTGDGPAVFVILIVGAVVGASAVLVELEFSPPYWMHAVLWLPAVLLLSLALLRVMKSLLAHLQYRNDAREGRLAERRD